MGHRFGQSRIRPGRFGQTARAVRGGAEQSPGGGEFSLRGPEIDGVRLSGPGGGRPLHRARGLSDCRLGGDLWAHHSTASGERNRYKERQPQELVHGSVPSLPSLVLHTCSGAGTGAQVVYCFLTPYAEVMEMTLGTAELARAREIAARVLDELNLDAYLFEVEPEEETWELRLECAFDNGWTSLSVPVDRQELLAAATDSSAFEKLVDQVRGRVGQCKTAD